MKDQLFDTPQKREESTEHLRQLMATEGWRVIQEVLKNNIKILEEQILDSDGDLERSKEQEMKLKRIYQVRLLDLPEKLIESLSESPVGDTDEFDPF